MTNGAKGDLVGRTVFIVISEPWEIELENTSRTQGAAVAAVQSFSEGVDRETLTADLAVPLVWRTVAYSSLVLYARRGTGLIDMTGSHGGVECNYVGLTEVQRAHGPAYDISSWRGGLGGIATLTLSET